MAIDKQTVLHTALLARLDLAGVDLDKLTSEMNAVIGYMDQLREADVTGIPMTVHARPLPLPLREDEPKPGLSADEALANAPKRLGNFLVVPRAVEEGGST